MKESEDEKPEMKKEWRLLVDILFQKSEQHEQTQIDRITQMARTLGRADGLHDTLASMIKGVFERLAEEKGEGNFQIKNIKLWVQEEEKRTSDFTDDTPRPWGFFSVLKSLPEESGSLEPCKYVLEIYIYFE